MDRQVLIQSERLTLRRTAPDDLQFVLDTEQHQENNRFISMWSRELHQDAMHSEDKLHLIVESEEERVGYVILAGLTNPNDSIELVRITISSKGKGHGKETLQLLQRWTFEQHGGHRLWLDVKDFNTRAQHVYEQMGFVAEGKLRECVKVGDTYDSLIIMSILRSEYCSE
ncbi:GNAT family N-acetyltransferase [Brevibacillus sp. SYSU BS000544]|uniref:GNAT family N-acetyltransferase n=1 Tax=Brevibacillus sp. SYSU BS000544 TaxID=3416443 RepID=UPI003CE4DDF5